MMLPRLRPVIGLITGTMLFLNASTALSQAKEMSADDLAHRADIVARGKVKSMKAQWEGNRERIVTYVTLEVEEYIKGDGGGPTMVIVNPGGEIDGEGEIYTHIASFREDEEVIVFTETDRRGRYRVTGGQLGKFRIERDADTGTRVVSGHRPIEEFEARVKQAAKEPGR